MIVFFLVILVSVISLSLTFANIKEADYGINVVHLALARVNCLRTLRPSMRNLVNIANDIAVN